MLIILYYFACCNWALGSIVHANTSNTQYFMQGQINSKSAEAVEEGNTKQQTHEESALDIVPIETVDV